jgi:DNA-binding NtrC family response regulator
MLLETKMNVDNLLEKKLRNSAKSISCEPRILLVEDDWQDALYLKELLEDCFGNDFDLNIDTVTNYSDAMLKLKESDYDMGIFDFRIGYLTGIDLLKSARAEGIELPVIFVTGQGDEKVAVEAIKLGALDYLVKDDLNVKLLSDSVLCVLERKFKTEQDLNSSQKAIYSKCNKFIYAFFLNLDTLLNGIYKNLKLS